MAHVYILCNMLLFINECTSASTLTLFIRILTFVFSQIRFDIILGFLYAILILYLCQGTVTGMVVGYITFVLHENPHSQVLQ